MEAKRFDLALERGYLSQRRPLFFLTLFTFIFLFVIYLLRLDLLSSDRNFGNMEHILSIINVADKRFAALVIYKLNSDPDAFIISKFGKQNIETALSDGRSLMVDTLGTTLGRTDYLTADKHTITTEPGYV